MIIGNEILKVEVKQVMDTVLVFRVLEQNFDTDREVLYSCGKYSMKLLRFPELRGNDVWIKGRHTDRNDMVGMWHYGSKEEADIMLAFIKEAVEYVCKEYAPKKEKVKLWQFVMGTGEVSNFFYTERLDKVWHGEKLVSHGQSSFGNWIRTNNYIEVEV